MVKFCWNNSTSGLPPAASFLAPKTDRAKAINKRIVSSSLDQKGMEVVEHKTKGTKSLSSSLPPSLAPN